MDLKQNNLTTYEYKQIFLRLSYFAPPWWLLNGINVVDLSRVYNIRLVICWLLYVVSTDFENLLARAMRLRRGLDLTLDNLMRMVLVRAHPRGLL